MHDKILEHFGFIQKSCGISEKEISSCVKCGSILIKRGISFKYLFESPCAGKATMSIEFGESYKMSPKADGSIVLLCENNGKSFCLSWPEDTIDIGFNKFVDVFFAKHKERLSLCESQN
jgi:hypothetical protein